MPEHIGFHNIVLIMKITIKYNKKKKEKKWVVLLNMYSRMKVNRVAGGSFTVARWWVSSECQCFLIETSVIIFSRSSEFLRIKRCYIGNNNLGRTIVFIILHRIFVDWHTVKFSFVNVMWTIHTIEKWLLKIS